MPGLWYAGSHGFESIAPDGSYRQNDEAAAAVPVLEQAAAELRQKLAHIKGSRVEHKRFAVAVHYRDVAAEDIGEVVASTHQVGRREHLRVTNGCKVVELRPDDDWNKGTTLTWIRDQIAGAGGPALPIFIGDDLTDEDAFDAVMPTASRSWCVTPRTAIARRQPSSRSSPWPDRSAPQRAQHQLHVSDGVVDVKRKPDPPGPRTCHNARVGQTVRFLCRKVQRDDR
jgi:trehalose-6-phosphatase